MLNPSFDDILDVILDYFASYDLEEYSTISKQFLAYFSIHFDIPRKEVAAELECTTQYISQLANKVSQGIREKDPSYIEIMDDLWTKLCDESN